MAYIGFSEANNHCVLRIFTRYKITQYILIITTNKFTFDIVQMDHDMNRKVFAAMWCLLALQINVFSQQATGGQESSMEEEATALVTLIYKEVSGTGEQSVDWEKVSSFFVEEAVIILRTSREATSQFTVEEFIQDFRNFYRGPLVGASGFREEVLQLESQVYHDMAFVAVVYAAEILDSARMPPKGVDFWLLTRRDSVWKVVSVTNEIVPPDGKLPGIFN
jgi:hypothetical protein